MRSLVLFYDLYCSMTRYDAEGLLLRDLLLYEKLVEAGAFDEIRIFTYHPRDREKLEELQRANAISKHITVLTPPAFLKGQIGAIIYSLVGPMMHARVLSKATLFKTHQVSGSWSGLIAKWLFRKPLLFRLGYPLSLRFKTEDKSLKYRITRLLETVMVRCSDHVAVTSRAMQSYYGAMARSRVITHAPSYVDVSGFTPVSKYDAKDPIAFIGRLEAVKNVGNLILACGRIGVPLDIYGGGSLEPDLVRLARTSGAQVTFHGYVKNDDLKKLHHRHSVCVLCSTREGMPKSLIEAMASGLICVSTPTDGALELIDDGKTGYFIDGYDAGAIELKLREVLTNLDPEVGRQASARMHRENSVEHCLDIELEIVRSLTASPQGNGAPGPRITSQSSNAVNTKGTA